MFSFQTLFSFSMICIYFFFLPVFLALLLNSPSIPECDSFLLPLKFLIPGGHTAEDTEQRWALKALF